MRVLIIGGAGYIGSHTAAELIEQNHQVTIIDNSPSTHLFSANAIEMIHGDYGDVTLLETLFSKIHFDVVMHFASSKQIKESILDPAKYYELVPKTIQLLNCLVRHRVPVFIFSSSSAVYGNTAQIPIDETCALQPTSPYGQSKLMVERILVDYQYAYGLRSISFRPFNAAGANSQKGYSEPVVHLISYIWECINSNTPFTVYGHELNTPDGTSIRDYVHVMDIAQAFIDAAQTLLENKKVVSPAYNLSTGRGASVYEILEKVFRISGKRIPILKKSSRMGDPACLVGDNSRAVNELGWKLSFSSLENIIRTSRSYQRLRKIA